MVEELDKNGSVPLSLAFPGPVSLVLLRHGAAHPEGHSGAGSSEGSLDIHYYAKLSAPLPSLLASDTR